jgi:hypothetical protein
VKKDHKSPFINKKKRHSRPQGYPTSYKDSRKNGETWHTSRVYEPVVMQVLGTGHPVVLSKKYFN